MRLAVIASFCIWVVSGLSAQQIQLQNRLIESPLGKVAFGLDVSPSGHEYVIAGRGDTMVVLDAVTNQEKRRVKLQPLTLAVGYSPDGKTLAALSHPGVLQLFRTDTWQLQHRVELDFRCGYLSFHPSKSWIAVGGAGSTVDIYDFHSGIKQRSIGRSERTQGVMFSPDGESIFVNAWYWKPTNRSELKRYSLTSDSVTSYPSQSKTLRRLVVSQDQKYLATVSPDGFVMMIGLKDRSQKQWHVDDKLSQFATFLTDHRTLLVGGKKGWHRFQVGREEPLEVLPASDLVNAYDGQLLPGSNELLIAHTRQPNQLTRWTIESSPSTSSPTRSSDVATMTPSVDPNSTIPPDADMQGDPARSGKSNVVAVENDDTEEAKKSPLFIASQMRTWTSSTGTSLEAAWIGSDTTDVLLRTKDDVEKVVPRRLLSEADQQLLAQVDRMRLDVARATITDDTDRDYEQINYRNAEVVDYRDNVRLPTERYRVVSAFDVEQDSFGRVWLSTAIGLMTFRDDGKFYFEAPVPVTNPTTDLGAKGRISALAIDRFDRVVATTNESAQLGDVYRYDGLRWTKISMPNSLMAEDVIRFGNGIVASGDFNGVAILAHDGCRIVEQNVYPGRVRTRRLTRLPDGRLLVRVKDQYPLLFDGKDFEVFEIPDWQLGLQGDVVDVLPRLEGDYYLIAGNAQARNVYRYAPETKARTIVYDAKDNRDAATYLFARGADGVIWLVTDQAVLRRKGDDWQKMGPGRSQVIPLPDGRVWSYVLYQPADYLGSNVQKPERLYAHIGNELMPQRTWAAAEKASPSTVRVWSDISGEYKTRASFVKVEAKGVVLRRTDGRTITIPIAQLSQQDQDFLKTLNRPRPSAIPSNSEFDASRFQYTSFIVSYFDLNPDGSRKTSVTNDSGAKVINDRYPNLKEEQYRLRRINGVVSDREGRVWIAGSAGLYEYVDGRIYYRHRGPDEVVDHPNLGKIATAEASRLSLDPEGVPLVYYSRVGEYFRFEEDQFESLGSVLVDDKPRPIFQLLTSKGELFAVGAFPGIANYSAGKWTLRSGSRQQEPPMFDHAAVMADGSVYLNELNREDLKLRLWRYQQGRFERILEGLKRGRVNKLLPRGDVLFVHANDGMERFALEINGNQQTVWNRINQTLGIATDGALLMDHGNQLGRHDGTAWKLFDHGSILDPEIYPLDNGDVWVAGVGMLIIPGND